MNKVIRGALTLSVLISSLLPLAGTSDWPQFQGDATNSGLTGCDVPESPRIIWSSDLVRVDVPPVVVGGSVYLLAGNGTLWSLDKETGGVSWTAQMDGWVFQTTTPAFCDGRIFAATDSGDLAAFDAETGELLWSRHITEKRFEAPITCHDGRIFLGEGSGRGMANKRYFSFDSNGTQVWNLTTETGGFQWCGASVVGDYLVFGDHGGVLRSVRIEDGDLVDELRLDDGSRIDFAREDGGRVRSSATSRNGWIYTASEFSADRGYAWKVGFDEEDGTFENRGWSSPVGFSTSTPAVADGRVYLGVGEHGHPGALACIDDATGDLIWSYPVEAGVKSSPVVSTSGDRTRIIFATARVGGSIYCIEDAGTDPALLWRFDPPDGGYILAGVAVSQGGVYFGTEEGQFYLLSDEET
ncbi:MAG: PQQ-binding-like beta-propeller repeat protein [Methanothrix sp.]